MMMMTTTMTSCLFTSDAPPRVTGARRRLVGYCPQFDALIGQMTVRETLWMYARLRGILAADIGRVVDKLIDQLTLDKYADREAGKLRYTAAKQNCLQSTIKVRPTASSSFRTLTHNTLEF